MPALRKRYSTHSAWLRTCARVAISDVFRAPQEWASLELQRLAADVTGYLALFAKVGRRAAEGLKQSAMEVAQEMKPSATETAQQIGDLDKLTSGRSPTAAASERAKAPMAQEVRAH